MLGFPFRKHAAALVASAFASLAALAPAAPGASAAEFKVGYAVRDITPQTDFPMWGYAARRNMPSNGAMDPLMAPVVVIDTGETKLAIMGLDMGRGPTAAMMKLIREEVKKTSNIDFVMISGSHTHHGPVTEFVDKPGCGPGKFDGGVAFAKEYPHKLIDAINEAAANAKPAKMGLASAHAPLNRNRHTKFNPKPVDDELTVIRFDDAATGAPIAFVVNFAAHPTILDTMMRKWSAEWPGEMKKLAGAELGAPCVFMQGSAGDMSPNTTEITQKLAQAAQQKDAERKAGGESLDILLEKYPAIYGMKAFGRQMADEIVKLGKDISTAVPAEPSIKGMDEEFSYDMRININDPKIKMQFELAFFKELVACFNEEIHDGKITPHLTTILLNGDLALVGGSGEFFCNHSKRLKDRARVKTLFFGYCNGHHMYFPTIEAAAEGGYGGDATVSWVGIGAGEEMTNKALINIYTWLGGFKTEIGGAKK